MLVAVVPGPGGACGDKCKHTGLLSLLVGRFQKRDYSEIAHLSISDPKPKPFLLDCPMPESHQNQTPASVSLVTYASLIEHSHPLHIRFRTS